MAEQVRGQGGSAGGGSGEIASGADRRVAQIEARVDRLVDAHARGRRQILILLVVVIALFGVFALVTYRQMQRNLAQERLKEAVAKRAPELQPDVRRHLDDVARDVVPVYRELAVARFKEVGPEVSRAAMDRLKTLPTDASAKIEQQVSTSRDRVLARIEPELAKRYPSLSDERKKEILSTYFHEKVEVENKQLASKVDAIRTQESIRVQAILEKFGIGAEPPPTVPRERERQFLHALVDVLMDTDLTANLAVTSGGTGSLLSRRATTGPSGSESSDDSMPTTAPATTTGPSASGSSASAAQ